LQHLVIDAGAERYHAYGVLSAVAQTFSASHTPTIHAKLGAKATQTIATSGLHNSGFQVYSDTLDISIKMFSTAAAHQSETRPPPRRLHSRHPCREQNTESSDVFLLVRRLWSNSWISQSHASQAQAAASHMHGTTCNAVLVAVCW
jgi:hypothetical protein